MKILFIIVALSLLICDSIQQEAFADVYGLQSSGINQDETSAVIKDSQGNIIWGGYYGSNNAFSWLSPSVYIAAGDCFIFKHNSSLELIWGISFGSNSADFLNALAVDSQDNVIAVGYTWGSDFNFNPPSTSNIASLSNVNYPNIFVAKYTSAGQFVWGKAWGTLGTEIAYGVVTGNSDHVFFGGTVEQQIDFGCGPVGNTNDAVIVKLDSSTGNCLYSKSFGAGGSEEIRSLAKDSYGAIYATGRYNSDNLNIDGSHPLPNTSPTGWSEYFVIKYDDVLNVVWTNAMGCQNTGTGYAIAVDSSNNVLMTGICQGNLTTPTGVIYSDYTDYRYVVLKLSSNGDYVWARIFSGGKAYGLGIAIGPADTVYTTGLYQSNLQMETPPLRVVVSYSPYTSVRGSAIVVNGNHTIVGGFFMGPVDLGGTIFYPNGTNKDASLLVYSEVTPAPSPSVTPSITPGWSPSTTPSVTPSPSATPTSTPSRTPSRTPTPTSSVTPTPTASVTPTTTPTASVTPSVTPSRTATPSVTPSITPTPSPGRPYGFSSITLRMVGNVDSFDPKSFINGIASVLQIPVDLIQIMNVTNGSVIVDFRIWDSASVYSADEANQLVDLVKNDDGTTLESVGITPLSISVDTSSARKSPSSSSNTQVVAVATAVPIASVAAIGIVGALYWRAKKKKSKQETELEDVDEEKSSSAHPQEQQPTTEPSSALRSSVRKSKPMEDYWEIDFRTITMSKELGRGAFGVVYLATWRNTPCVVKQLDSSNGSSAEAFMKEASNVKHLRPHPNVCQVLGVCTDPVYPLCIVMEHVTYGSLWDMLKDQKLKVDLAIALDFGIDIANGMLHLHSENVIHCDLACRNLLVAPKGHGEYSIKVTDFGLSRVLGESDQDIYNASKKSMFPVRWTAPETLRAQIVSKPMDVWSFGITMWELIEARQPYPGLSNTQVVEAVCDQGYRLPCPQAIQMPDKLWELIQKCWMMEPVDRPDFKQVSEELLDIKQEVFPPQDLKPAKKDVTKSRGNTHTPAYQDATSNAEFPPVTTPLYSDATANQKPAQELPATETTETVNLPVYGNQEVPVV